MMRVLFRGHGEPDRFHEMDEPFCDLCTVPTPDGGQAYYRLVRGTGYDRLAYVETDPPVSVILPTVEDKTRRRQHIMDSVIDVAGDFVYYNRKEDDNLPRGEIEAAVAAGEITKDEIVAAFADGIGDLTGD